MLLSQPAWLLCSPSHCFLWRENKNYVRLCHFQLSQRKERQNSGWFAWFKGRYKNEGNSVSRLGFFFSQVGFQLSLWSLILILCLVYGYIISINLNQRMSYCRWGSGQATPYMAVWHIEYLKLKEFGKWHVQEGLTFPDAGCQPSCERCLLCTQRTGASLSQKKGHRNLKQALLFPPFYLLFIGWIYISVISFHDFALFIKPSINTLRFNLFIGSSFPYEGSHVIKH